MSNSCYRLFASTSFTSSQSSFQYFYIDFKTFCKTFFGKLSVNLKENVIGEAFGTETTKRNCVSYKKGCSVGILHSINWLNSSTNSEKERYSFFFIFLEILLNFCTVRFSFTTAFKWLTFLKSWNMLTFKWLTFFKSWNMLTLKNQFFPSNFSVPVIFCSLILEPGFCLLDW